jgi:A/G-specific adenine glycosylase
MGRCLRLPCRFRPPASGFRRQLLTWYWAHGRELPWRQTSDPYHILVSEIMLQQTQVDRVLPKYHEWLGKYPSLTALAEAAEDDVVQTWRARATTSGRGACSRSRGNR